MLLNYDTFQFCSFEITFCNKSIFNRSFLCLLIHYLISQLHLYYPNFIHFFKIICQHLKDKDCLLFLKMQKIHLHLVNLALGIKEEGWSSYSTKESSAMFLFAIKFASKLTFPTKLCKFHIKDYSYHNPNLGIEIIILKTQKQT